MSTWPQCDASLARAQEWSRNHGYPVWNYCSKIHCDEYTSDNHQYCYCEGPYAGPPNVGPDGKCIHGVGSIIPRAADRCYCCCSCFAWNTPIAIDATQVKAVQDFEINDLVWVAKDSNLSSWESQKIKFSSGAGKDGKNRLIKVHFGDHSEGIRLAPDAFISQYVTPDQSEKFFKILSTDPNDYIGADGLVNLLMVRKTNAAGISTILNVPEIVGHEVYSLLKTDSNYLLVTGSQPFLLEGGNMKKAEKLVPGIDKLMRADGTSTPLLSLEVGMFEKGVHHIATTDEPAKSLDGHLILANGIVVGDYAVQLAMGKGQAISDAHHNDPAFGTKEYGKMHGHLMATPFSARVSADHVQETNLFVLNHEDFAAKIPEGAYAYFTESEARKLEANAPIYPASNNFAEPDVLYVFRLFKGVYSDIHFYYDQNNMEPNAYAFEEFGQKFVVLNAGLSLVEGVFYEGVSMILANLVGRLRNSGDVSPLISPVGKADYNVYPMFAGIFHFAPAAAMNFDNGFKQITKLFGYIKEKRKPLSRISLECRLDCLTAGYHAKPLPHCAGGPPNPALELVNISAEQSSDDQAAMVTIAFNLPLDQATAETLGNYLFNPDVPVFRAKVSESDQNIVNISAQILPDTEYELVVSGILSSKHQPLVLGKNGGTFTLNS